MALTDINSAYQKQVKKFLQLLAVEKDCSMAAIGRLTDQTRQNWSKKVNHGTVNASELFMIADKLNLELKFVDKATGEILP